MSTPRRSVALNGLGILLFVVAWQIVGSTLGDALLATPVEVARGLPKLFGRPGFWSAAGQMLIETVVGYALTLLVGIPLGVAMGRLSGVRLIVKPWAQTAVVVSAAALVPLLLLIVGRGPLLSIAIVFASTVWFVALTMMEAARTLRPNHLAVARVFGSGDLQRFRWVILPSLYPYAIVAARVALIQAIRAVVTAQMFISVGFGGLINDAGLDISTTGLFGLLGVLMVVSLVATWLLDAVSHLVAPWYVARTRAG